MQKFTLLILFLIFGVNPLGATTLKIGIFSEINIQSLEVFVSQGGYNIFIDDQKVGQLIEKEKANFVKEGLSVSVYKNGNKLGSGKNAKLTRINWQTSFKLSPTSPQRPGRIYPDNLIVNANKNGLQTLNHVDIEKYIDGVIEAESGSKQNLEYYKVQALISRTYALNQMHKHVHQGFNLCDQVHCQVYKGKSNSSPLIPEGVKQTEGLVVVDADLKLISTVFHANCGGQTLNSEHVWTYPLPYLKAVKDTLCFGRKQSNWEKVIKKDDWLKYLSKKFGISINDSLLTDALCNHTPINNKRELYLGNIITKIPLKTVRYDWDLRSTWFSIKPHPENADELIFTGRGFGHGVGLCQEGAMARSELGQSFIQILQHYFTDIHVIDLSVLTQIRP